MLKRDSSVSAQHTSLIIKSCIKHRLGLQPGQYVSLAQVIRGLLFVIFWPFLKRMGYGLTPKDAVVLSW